MSMGAMEKMVANMLGITPESMHKTLSDFSTLASDLKAQLDRIESALEIVHENMADLSADIGALKNVGSNGNDDNRGGDSGRVASDGDTRQRNRKPRGSNGTGDAI